MISHGEHAKLKCPQLHTQAKNYQLLEKKEVDVKVEARGVHVSRKCEKGGICPYFLKEHLN